MSIAGSTRDLGRWALAIVWSLSLALLLGCSETADPLDARALRRQFPEQADAILQGPLAFAPTGDGFEAVQPLDARPHRAGADRLRSRFPRDGDGDVRFLLPDGSEAQVTELGATGAGEIAEGAVAYARAGGTSFWTALEDGYEEWLLLDPGAVRRDAPVAAWQVDGADLRQDGDAVEVADARGAPQIRVTAPEAYAAGGRPVATRLIAQGQRVELWVEAESETVLVDPRWRLIRKMDVPRHRHTATRLSDGRVLIAGGYQRRDAVDSAEVFDPDSGAWSTQAPMLAARGDHTATVLPDGRILVAGGDTNTDGPEGVLASVEVFDPRSGAWSAGKPMSAARGDHTATPLPDGRVFVAGGHGPEGALDSVEVFDPRSGAWSALASMPTARTDHAATRLPDGRVLVVGGDGRDGVLGSVEVFDPRSGAWSALAPMLTARMGHTATLLNDGRVLVTGGYTPQGDFDSAELFDVESNTWRAVNPMLAARVWHTATELRDGRVLVAGGHDRINATDSAEVFDPVSDTWTTVQSMYTSRNEHTATLLEDGRVLIAGGSGHGTINDAEVLDLDAGAWVPLGPLNHARHSHTATLLEDGRVLVASGEVNRGGVMAGGLTASAEVFDPISGTWRAVDPLRNARRSHSATLLEDGRVLVAGGYMELDENKIRSLDSVEVFDPAAGAWGSLSPLLATRHGHTATRLPDGRVLVAGGRNQEGVHDSAELFDPDLDQWKPVGPMLAPRQGHTATLLHDGRVLIAGGYGPEGVLDSAELFDPGSEQWLPLAPMIAGRYDHTATLLRDGRVLVAGGFAPTDILASAEVFVPESGRWMPLGPMHTVRNAHAATLLPDGRVLVVGGADMQGWTLQPNTAEAFDPATGTWLPLEPLPVGRYWHTATLLPDGRVLVAGGGGGPDGPKLDSVFAFRPMPAGDPCAADVECHSGSCTDGVCCEQRCDVYLCEACSELRGASADGVCTSLHPDYAPFACSPATGERLKPCKSVHDCVDGFVCDVSDGPGECVSPPPNGGFLDKGGCHLADPAAAEPTRRVPAELGLLVLAAVTTALRRRRR
ncbi:kelch repeat-containing protein [Sorangium sp. So ce1335]|uniref:kelch repeat-containing protein n=1 Tax=Sorangium sp. So ce1335 TaxID=3133335 RepID=UPI003F62CA65